jgi:hypothetical protein
VLLVEALHRRVTGQNPCEVNERPVPSDGTCAASRRPAEPLVSQALDLAEWKELRKQGNQLRLRLQLLDVADDALGRVVVAEPRGVRLVGDR